MSVDWARVAHELDAAVQTPRLGLVELKEGQTRSLAAMARRIRQGQHALLLADEVGMGKTIIAASLIKAVQKAGGRSVVIIPPGLGAQWLAELQRLDPEDRTLLPLRSLWTFVMAYGRDEQTATAAKDRRLQREWPQSQWSDEKIILLSHNLANVRQTERTIPLYHGLGIAMLKCLQDVRRYVREGDIPQSRDAADVIAASLSNSEQDGLLTALTEETDPMRQSWLVTGRGLGTFDLVVIDEAHKARGVKTSLGRVLGDIIWKTANAFHLGLTATPVELDAEQWIDTLNRLTVPQEEQTALRKLIRDYVAEVERLRECDALTPQSVTRFASVAKDFKEHLQPWVLRRHKHEDPFLRQFCEAKGSHRQLVPVAVDLAGTGIAPEWKRAFFAVEALSVLETHQLSPAMRRLRLSLPDAQGMALLDNLLENEDDVTQHPLQAAWLSLVTRLRRNGFATIFAQPAIRHTVEAIEAAVRAGEKVLVFGRFTQPLRALTFLLDAREMVRRLCGDDVPGNRWPQSGLGAADEEHDAALVAALADPNVNICGLNRDSVAAMLKARSKKYEDERRFNLAKMREELQRRAGLDAAAARLLGRWRAANDGSHDHDTVLLLAALEDQRPAGKRHQPWNVEELLEAYCALVREVAGDSDEEELAEPFEKRLRQHLNDFGQREGHFARLMYGATAPQTRRLLQAGFNREGGWPQILVAQSAVGREGLNLHRACRTVVMLHLEWNPAHAEQQIGRVDRIDSRWEREAREFMKAGHNGEPPRIVVRPVVVGGTYDEYHWSVLMRRWDNMRAQLNGDVLPDTSCDLVDTTRAALIAEARAAAPDFAP